MTAPLPALVALRDAVGAWNGIASIPPKIISLACEYFHDNAHLSAFIDALLGKIDASERLRKALLPDWHPRTAKLPNEDDGWEAELWDPETCLLICATGPVESIARTLAVLNALIGKERE